MSRTARALIAGLAAAGVLVVGAGAAFADDYDSDDSGRSSSSSSADSEDGGSSSTDSEDSEDSQEVEAPATGAADPVSGLLGSLPLGLGL